MANERRPEQESFHDVIEQIRKGVSTAPTYRIFTLPLNIARTGEELALAGYNFQVIDASDGFANVEIQFNETLATKVPFKRGDQVITPFYRFYIHNSAQPDAFLKIAISPHFDLWRFIPNPFASAIINNVYNPASPGNIRNQLAENVAGVIYRNFIPFPGPAVNNNRVIQVFNPAGSGKVIHVLEIASWAGAVDTWAARYYNTALTDLAVISGVAGGLLSNLNQNIVEPNNKSKAQIRSQDFVTAAFPPAGAGPEQWFHIGNGTGSNNLSMQTGHFPVLYPGKGLIAYRALNTITGIGGEHNADFSTLGGAPLYITIIES